MFKVEVYIIGLLFTLLLFGGTLHKLVSVYIGIGNEKLDYIRHW